MRQDRGMPIPEFRTPGMRRVLEGMRQLDDELTCWDEQEAPSGASPAVVPWFPNVWGVRCKMAGGQVAIGGSCRGEVSCGGAAHW